MNLETVPEIKDAIEEILLWKLKNSDDECFNLTERKIAEALSTGLQKFIPSLT